jgi:hypothetical protein
MTQKLAASLAVAVCLAAAAARSAAADGMVNPEPEPQAVEDAGGGAPQGPSLSAKLVGGQARADSAEVQVKVSGVDSPRLQYKVDDGPAIETQDTKIKVRGLKPGSHRISVLLEGQDGAPLGPSQSLDVHITQ